MESDRTIKNIVKEIIRECTHKGIQIHENFAMYYVKLLALDPNWRISSNFHTNRADMQQFIRFVIDKFQDQIVPSIVTLKMQFYFGCNFDNRRHFVQRNRTELMTKLEPLRREILETDASHWMDQDEQLVDKLYKKIVYFITLACGLGNPVLEPVYTEALTSLKSILNKNELIEFASQDESRKQEQLMDFIHLIAGMRLFNKFCNVGGQGIEDLLNLLCQALEATNNELQKVLVQTMDKVNLLTTAVDDAYVIEINNKNDSYEAVCSLPDGIELEDLEYAKNLLIVYRQYELQIRKLMSEVHNSEEKAARLFYNYRDTLEETHNTVKDRIAIPVLSVYPLFTKLYDIWCKIQDETILLAKLNQIQNNLEIYVKQVVLVDSIIEAMIGPKGTLTDAERLEATSTDQIPQVDNNAVIVDVDVNQDIDLEYLGFCAWKIVATNGGLIPGNPAMGVTKVLGKNYVFSSLDAAQAFNQDPERFVLETLNMARKKPELINLLQIEDQLDLIQDIEDLVIESPEVLETSNAVVQTETHPVSTKIDLKYKWNIWDLKREAIQLANLSHCLTVSTQTIKSNNRNAVRVQTYEMREKNVQTKRDHSSNVPRPLTYIFGLRGRKDNEQHIVDLTRPIVDDEKPICKPVSSNVAT